MRGTRKTLLLFAVGAFLFTAAADPFLEYLQIGQYRRAMLVLALSGLVLLVASWRAGRLPPRFRPWGYGLMHLLALAVVAGATILLIQTLSVGQYRRAIASLGGVLLALMVLGYNTSLLAQTKRLSARYLIADGALLLGVLGGAGLFSEYFFLGQFRRAILVTAIMVLVIAISGVLVGSRVGRGKVWVPEILYLAVVVGCLGSVPFFWSYLSAGQFRRALLALTIGGVCAILATYWTYTVEPEGEWWGW